MQRYVECLRFFPPGEVMPFAEGECAECKPAAVAKLAAGLPLGWFWRKGRILLVARTPEPKPFPLRCIVCNTRTDPGEGLNVPVLNVIEEHEWKYHMCGEHRQKLRRKNRSFWSLLLGTIVIIVCGFAMHILVLLGVAVGLFLATFIVALRPPRELRPLAVHAPNYWRFQNCGRAFLEEFPDWKG